MQYGDLVSGALRIAWRHRYLWLLAVLGGGGTSAGCFPSGGSNLNFDSLSNPRSGRSGASPDLSQVHLPEWFWPAVIVAIAAFVMFLLVLFLIGCVAAPAAIRGAAEHDAGRPFGLGPAWRAGRHRFGAVLRLRLLVLAVSLAAALPCVLAAAAAAILFVRHSPGAGAALGGLAVLLGLAWAAFSLVLGVVSNLALRIATLELAGAGGSLRRAAELVRRRKGRVAVLWLLAWGLSLAAGLGIGLAAVIAVIPVVGLVVAAYAVGHAAGAAVVGGLLGIVLFAALLVVAGAVGAFMSTYWTLGYRRLDVDVPG